MSDIQLTQNTKNEKDEKEKGPIGKISNFLSNFLIKILTEGLGAAFGVAIVVFVGYTVMGVYHQGEAAKRFEQELDNISIRIEQISSKQESLAHDIFVVKTEGLANKKESEENLEKRSNKLREEIIESNQIALQLFMEQLASSDKNTASTPQKEFPASPPVIIDAPDGPFILNQDLLGIKKETDALKYRLRQEQQKVQKW